MQRGLVGSEDVYKRQTQSTWVPMEFASSKAYISKSKIKMGSLSQPESKEESKLPSKPVIPPAKEALSSEKDVSEQHQAHPIPSMPLSSPAYFAKDLGAVSYTHLTLPTILLVQISVVAVSLKKKKPRQKNARASSIRSTTSL
eukprot:TRINITY_DN26188_c0_g1_i1.p1 TRINITY_DN26188_c0_g1~~TRINITY_DN26188_c0_g1_i1.p1  ORF type:complete len:143 (+),score=34.47 TRINITY_DN26188_c0_g1_i1:123-551(+)